MVIEPITTTNTIVCGDCKDQLERIPDESVDLIYLDPPFFSNRNYEIIWKDGSEIRSFIDTEFYTLICECGEIFPDKNAFCAKCGAARDKATEHKSKDIQAYLQWLHPRLEKCRDVLKPTGSIYVHLDHHAVFQVKVMMDEIFDDKRFKTMITWKRCGSKGNAKTFANNSDYILYYVKNNEFTFNIRYGEYSKATLKMFKYDDHDGRGCYASGPINAPGGKGYMYNLGYGEKCPTGGYRWKEETMLEKIADNRVILKPNKIPRQKRYLSDARGVPYDNVWGDIENVKTPTYPTEKPEELLERIIKASSNPGDVILDPFCGCGTAVTVAQKLGRKWIGIDVSPTACRVMVKRLRDIENDWVRIKEDDIIDLPRTYEELSEMDHFEFQNLVVAKLDGKINPKKVGDKGIDGWTYKRDNFGMRYKQVGYDAAIQVKQTKKPNKSNNIGRPTVQGFVGAMTGDTKNTDGKTGIFVAFGFTSEAEEYVKAIKVESGISVKLVTVKELFGCE